MRGLHLILQRDASIISPIRLLKEGTLNDGSLSEVRRGHDVSALDRRFFHMDQPDAAGGYPLGKRFGAGAGYGPEPRFAQGATGKGGH